MSNKYVRKELTKKDRYLAKLIDQMNNDAEITAIFRSNLPEFEKDIQILTILIDSGKFHFEVTQREMLASFIESKVRSGKSRFKAEKHLEKAMEFFKENKLLEAAGCFAKALVTLPIITREDMKKLSNIYFQRSKIFAQLGDEEARAIDLYFAGSADPDFLNDKETEKNIILKHQNVIIQSCCVDDKKMFQLNPNVHILINNEINNEINLIPKIKLPVDTNIIVERPLCKYSCTTFDNCACCDRYIRDFLYWPCLSCSDIVFCSQACWTKERFQHYYECGITSYMKQMPIFLLMVRYYAKSSNTALTPFRPDVNYIGEFLSSVLEPDKHPMNNKEYLNVFRQCMDGHKKRKQLAQSPKNYYAVLIMAVELLYLLDACMLNQQTFRKAMETEQDLGSPVTIVPDIGQFMWSTKRKPLRPTDIIELCVHVFQDLKRFIASPFCKFELQALNYKENYRKERRMLLLTGLLFPEQQTVMANLLPKFNQNNGLIEIKASRNLTEKDRLVLNKNMSVIPLAPF